MLLEYYVFDSMVLVVSFKMLWQVLDCLLVGCQVIIFFLDVV